MKRHLPSVRYLVAVVVLSTVAGIVAWSAVTADAPAQAQADTTAGVSAAVATAGFFVKFDGIDGEAKDVEHLGWSELLSFDQAHSMPVDTSTGLSTGRAELEPILLSKTFDKASPKLAEAVLNGRTFPSVEIQLTAVDADGARVTYFVYELTDARVISYSVGGSSGGSAPTEQISLNFGQIKVTYTERDSTGRAKGKVEYTWDVAGGSR